MTEPVRAMIDVQGYTGAREGEVVAMRPMDIETTGEAWIYTPESHNTAHRGHRRAIVLGPRARALVELFLRDRDPKAFRFSPTEAEAARHAAMRVDRKSRPSVNKNHDDRRTERKGRGKRALKDCERRSECAALGGKQCSAGEEGIAR